MERMVTTATLKKMKVNKEPITMLTAYDYPSAKLAEEAGIDIILVGDSLGMVVLGYDTTIPVTMADMLHHTKAVTRGAKKSFVVTDMPFLSYQVSLEEAVKNAGLILQEGLAKAVKIEGGSEVAGIINKLTQIGIPVMGHIGLTPQSVHQLGGYKVQGKDIEQAKKLITDAKKLEEAGAFAIVLEAIPESLAEIITNNLTIPTIGIGAGRNCDGQVLVFHDLIQYANQLRPSFVKSYANVGLDIKNAISTYISEVKNHIFPSREHSYSINNDIINKIYGGELINEDNK